MNNLHIINETEHKSIIAKLQDLNVSGGHFTNGTYAYDAEKVVPTTLAGFQHKMDIEKTAGSALIIAVNSQKSMDDIMEEKISNARAAVKAQYQEYADITLESISKEEITAEGAKVMAKVKEKAVALKEQKDMETQDVRAKKVAIPLAQENPGRTVIVMFYDEGTPQELYDAVNAAQVAKETLYKFGYGTNEKEGKIVGAEHAKETHGHPMPDNEKPLCDQQTVREDQPNVIVTDLCVAVGKHGLPYITKDNKILFALKHPDNYKYAQTGPRPKPTAGSAPKPAV